MGVVVWCGGSAPTFCAGASGYGSANLTDVCTEHFLKHLSKIGSPVKVLEIDETLFTRRKYNRSRVVEKQWCFWGIERGTNKCFVVSVERQDAATLLPLIEQYVVSGTTIEGHNLRYGTERALWNSYIDEFVWKKVYRDNVLYHLWSQIAEHYPPPSGSVRKCGLIHRLLIRLPYDSPIGANAAFLPGFPT
ncbi:unnamed protein product [Enterobius vermicularis]|uniref:DDE_Tnp_IS1595 domain-containing protein n=1 Tax=Enterobius vermicularis TaxID=51028 RepID=A0A0N4VBB3_ENTVE|nr:unnamed protein product [Enterobius vermicularis]